MEERFDVRAILQRHIQQLDQFLQVVSTPDELVKLSDALERAICTYDRLEN